MSEYNLPFLPPSTITLPIFIPPFNNNDPLFYDVRDFYRAMFDDFSDYIFGNVVRTISAENFVFASGSTYFYSYGNESSSGRSFNITLPQNSYFEGSYYAIVLCKFQIRDLSSRSVRPLWSLISPANYERAIKAFYNCRLDLELIYPFCRQVGSGWNIKFNFRPDRILINAHKNSEVSPQNNLLLMYTYIPRLAVYSKNSSSIINLQLPDPIMTRWDGTTFPKIVEFIRVFMDRLYSEGLVSYRYGNYDSAWSVDYVVFTSHASIWGYIKPISIDNPVPTGLPIFAPVSSGGGYGGYRGY